MSLLTRFRDASPGQQIAAALGGGGLIGALLLAGYFTWFHSPYQVLYSGLRPADAAAVVTELDKKKTPYEFRDGGATVLVPAKLADATRVALAGEDLPLKGVVGFEIFNKSDMGLTEFAQQVNYRRALQGELERTIMQLAGVDSARVHLTIAEPSVFRDDRRPSKASVTVIPRPGRTLPPPTISGVQRLVAAAVPDLDPADVVVLDANGDVVSGGAPTPARDPQSQERSAIEAYYAGRIHQALAAVDPQGQVGVTVVAHPAPTPAQPDPLGVWSPAARSFPLTVSLSLRADAPPSSELRDLAERAADLSPERGDSLSFAFVASPAVAAVSTPAPIAPPPPSQGALGRTLGSPLRTLLLALATLALIVAAVALSRRFAAPTRLSARQQDLYAERLKALLERSDADAAAAR